MTKVYLFYSFSITEFRTTAHFTELGTIPGFGHVLHLHLKPIKITSHARNQDIFTSPSSPVHNLKCFQQAFMVILNENQNKFCKDDDLSLVDVWLGEELSAEAGVAPQPQDERDAHDQEGADYYEGDQEGRVSFL